MGAGQRGSDSTEVTVLVVEDDALLRSVVLMMLEDAGYPAVAAEDYAEAERLVASRRVGLLLADSNLPAGVGPDDAREFARRHGLPLLMMSGAFTTPTPDRLPKPFTDRDLIAAVERALAQGRG